jgi:hypothetical protein
MIPEFENLEPDEQDLLYKAPVLVAILVAGADGKIDKSEMREAISISGMKKIKARKDLLQYYNEVGKDFEDKLKFAILKYPSGVKERQDMIANELAGLSAILPKLNRKFAITFYASLKDFAKRIAESSGGILGYMSIGYEESKLIDLKMIKDPSK